MMTSLQVDSIDQSFDRAGIENIGTRRTPQVD